MAGGAPRGNQNAAKRNRLLGDGLLRELTQNPDDALAIVRRTIESAKAGESWAQQLVYDRVDGKLAVPLGGSDELPPLLVANRIELVDLANSSARATTET